MTPELLPEADRLPLSNTFDRLISSNLALTESVAKLVTSSGKLVRLTYGVLICNAILIAAIVFTAWRR